VHDPGVLAGPLTGGACQAGRYIRYGRWLLAVKLIWSRCRPKHHEIPGNVTTTVSANQPHHVRRNDALPPSAITIRMASLLSW